MQLGSFLSLVLAAYWQLELLTQPIVIVLFLFLVLHWLFMFLRDRSQTLKGGPDVKYAAAGALVYLFIYKFAMSICLSVCLSVCLFRYVFGRASTYGAETWHGGRVWRAGGNCQLFVATRQVKGHLEVNLFRNAVRPQNLVTMIVEGPLGHCHGQRSCRCHLGSTRG